MLITVKSGRTVSNSGLQVKLFTDRSGVGDLDYPRCTAEGATSQTAHNHHEISQFASLKWAHKHRPRSNRLEQNRIKRKRNETTEWTRSSLMNLRFAHRSTKWTSRSCETRWKLSTVCREVDEKRQWNLRTRRQSFQSRHQQDSFSTHTSIKSAEPSKKSAQFSVS